MKDHKAKNIQHNNRVNICIDDQGATIFICNYSWHQKDILS